MITVSVTPETVRVSGHAGYGPHGHDIVCEAVTALTQTLILSLYELTPDTPAYGLDSGEFILDVKDLGADAQLLVRSFLVGIRMLAGAYDKHVTLTEHSRH